MPSGIIIISCLLNLKLYCNITERMKKIPDTASKMPVLLKLCRIFSCSRNERIIPEIKIPTPKIHSTSQSVTKFKSSVIGTIEYTKLSPSVRKSGNWAPNPLNRALKKILTGIINIKTASSWSFLKFQTIVLKLDNT